MSDLLQQFKEYLHYRCTRPRKHTVRNR